MKYLFLLFDDEDVWDQMKEDKKTSIVASYFEYAQALRETGAMLAGAPLPHSRDAKRVKKDVVQDGPFADGKEQLGGYFLVEARDLDDALDLAARCPCATYGHVEVRPVWNIGE